MVKNYLSIFSMVLSVVVAAPKYGFAQNQSEVSGQVTDAETGETLPGVNVIVRGTTAHLQIRTEDIP